MNYIYIVAGTLFTFIFIAQMFEFATYNKKKKVPIDKNHRR